MNDGFFSFETRGDDRDIESSRYGDHADIDRPSTSPANPLTLERVITALPQLGAVLWLLRSERDHMFPRARLLSNGVLLLDHPALGVLADCVAVRAFSAVTPHGPREWLEFRDTNDEALAKVYLLPDTDYMAWEAMTAGCTVTVFDAASHRQSPRFLLCQALMGRTRHAWRARLVRLPLLRLSGVSVLGLRKPGAISALGDRIAKSIVGDDRALWHGA